MDHTQNWETINNTAGDELTQRMPVPGGWIYRSYIFSPGDDSGISVALCFVPDRRVSNID